MKENKSLTLGLEAVIDLVWEEEIFQPFGMMEVDCCAGSCPTNPGGGACTGCCCYDEVLVSGNAC